MTTNTITLPVPAAITPAANANPLHIVSQAFNVLVAWQKASQQRRHMEALEDWQLDDVGLTRAHINAQLTADAETPIWDQFAR
ncbi:MAG: DUF1127 domain-containing protein [Magnetovibrio sp.]|nr:DUF1127 domain-containing protein [Magnetovibrio sp.]